jgi:hypothetical protein
MHRKTRVPSVYHREETLTEVQATGADRLSSETAGSFGLVRRVRRRREYRLDDDSRPSDPALTTDTTLRV